ncbi:MAG: N-acetylmuramic acid 6-phosphate etherase, partial [Nocardioidaceae bacterium]|nr:N-acetylmuramic acid 6-phosphate etherase [Nocardioidaceae bacterium]
RHHELDTYSTARLVQAMTAEEASVPAALERATPQITAAVDAIVERMRRGGRLIYCGAGTAGRMGVLDASECPPTFGTDPSLVIGLIAGGEAAIQHAVENAEDDRVAGVRDVAGVGLRDVDVVVGLSASGRTPYVVAALEHARRQGALTIAVVCNPGSEMCRVADLPIEVVVGPELVTGSTRLKAGSAQKFVCNALSTLTMVRLGKTYGSLMVNMQATNAKLRARAERTIMLATGVDGATAAQTLTAAEDSLKEAILMLRTGLDLAAARDLLDRHDGFLRAALEAAPEASTQE